MKLSIKFEWNLEKNEILKIEKNVCFEDILVAFENGKLLDILEHPNKEKHLNQKLYVVDINNYAHVVPFIENNDIIFLKTIIPSRKMTKKYLKGGSNNNEIYKT